MPGCVFRHLQFNQEEKGEEEKSQVKMLQKTRTEKETLQKMSGDAQTRRRLGPDVRLGPIASRSVVCNQRLQAIVCRWIEPLIQARQYRWSIERLSMHRAQKAKAWISGPSTQQGRARLRPDCSVRWVPHPTATGQTSRQR